MHVHILCSFPSRGIVKSEEGITATECDEMTTFFREATTSIALTAKSINKLDKCDAQFTFYCLQLLVPSLTALFRHVGLHKVGSRLIHGSIKTQCRYIFQNLVEMAMGTGPVYVGRWVWFGAWLRTKSLCMIIVINYLSHTALHWF